MLGSSDAVYAAEGGGEGKDEVGKGSVRASHPAVQDVEMVAMMIGRGLDV